MTHSHNKVIVWTVHVFRQLNGRLETGPCSVTGWLRAKRIYSKTDPEIGYDEGQEHEIYAVTF